MSSIDNAAALGRGQDERRDAAERKTADRLWAYSDAVFAVIVTIMVLQLRPPKSHHLSALFGLWPTVISYVVSYVFIAIIWINHHYLTRFIRTPSLGLMWTNFLHLLLVSLLPFTTAWMAQTRLAPMPVMVYAGLFLCADGAYNALEHHILKQTREITEEARRIARRRSLLALALFAAATLAAAFEPWLGFVLVCSALVLHIKPDIGSGRAAPKT
ncbi:MAG: TMEM175 family protein [Solirubrobacteraceae bacterium]